MLPRPSGGPSRRRVIAFCLVAALPSLSGICRAAAQTPQPWLFVETIANTKPTGAVTFLRDDSSGALTLLAASQTTFTNPCGPSTIDPKGRFLYGYCADGLSMYALDTTTGAATEIATSPFQASTGQFGVLVVAESSGQFVYLVKSDLLQAPSTSTLTLDTFHVDASTPALVPVSSQTLPVEGAWVDGGIVGDPNGHGIAVLINQFPSPPTQFPNALLYLITFDPVTGAATLDPTGGTVVGSRGLAIRISTRGNFLALGYGSSRASLSIYQVNPLNFWADVFGHRGPGQRAEPHGHRSDVSELDFFRSHRTGDVCAGAAFRNFELRQLFRTAGFQHIPGAAIVTDGGEQREFFNLRAESAGSICLFCQFSKRRLRNQRV